jgi:hypothetical protein
MGKKKEDGPKLYPAPFQGKHHTAATRLRISESLKGRRVSKATRQKMSAAKKGKPNPMEGRKHSEATKKKMRESRKRILAAKGK